MTLFQRLLTKTRSMEIVEAENMPKNNNIESKDKPQEKTEEEKGLSVVNSNQEETKQI